MLVAGTVYTWALGVLHSLYYYMVTLFASVSMRKQTLLLLRKPDKTKSDCQLFGRCCKVLGA